MRPVYNPIEKQNLKILWSVISKQPNIERLKLKITKNRLSCWRVKLKKKLKKKQNTIIINSILWVWLQWFNPMFYRFVNIKNLVVLLCFYWWNIDFSLKSPKKNHCYTHGNIIEQLVILY